MKQEITPPCDLAGAYFKGREHLVSAASSATRGDVGATVSEIAYYRKGVADDAKEDLIAEILNTAYKNGVELYLGYSESAVLVGDFDRAGEWLMNVDECIEKGDIEPTTEQQKRIDVLREMVSRVTESNS